MTSGNGNPTSALDDELRERIVQAAAELLADGGRGAVTTRAVAGRVGASPPTIYRLFGEKNGLLSAVAEYGYAGFLAAKDPLRPTDDPVDDLRSAWSLAVEFGLDHAELFLLMYGEPHSEAMAAAARTGARRMHARIQRVAAAGRLRVEESLAAAILQASARGAVLTWLDLPEGQRDPGFIAAMREATIAAVTVEHSVLPEPGRASAARTLKANLPGQTSLSPAEQQLLVDWLDRLNAEAGEPGGASERVGAAERFGTVGAAESAGSAGSIEAGQPVGAAEPIGTAEPAGTIGAAESAGSAGAIEAGEPVGGAEPVGAAEPVWTTGAA